MKTTFILCSIGILLGPFCSSATLAITEEEIVSQLVQREQSIKSIYGKFNLSAQILMNDGNKVEVEKQYEWIKKDNIQKLTLEFKSIPAKFKDTTIMTEKEIRSFDGQVTKQFLPESKRASIFSGGQMFSLGKVPADWLFLRIQEKSLSVYLKQDSMSLKYAGEMKLEERKCHLLELAGPKTNGKLYLADEQGLFPAKFDVNLINHTLPFNTRGEYIFSEFKHYGNIIMPTKVIVSVFRVYPDKEQLEMKEIFTVEQLEVNTQIPDTDLLIQFPAGTRVYDSVADKDYVVR